MVFQIFGFLEILTTEELKLKNAERHKYIRNHMHK